MKKNIHFLHIGKTGGSVLKDAFKKIKSIKYNIIAHEHSTKLIHIPKGEYFFFFTRDPIRRFISGFYSRKRKGLPRYSCPWTDEEKMSFKIFKTPEDLGRALSSKNNKLKSEAIFAMKSISHVNSSYWDWFLNEEYFLSRKNDIFFIGQQEKLGRDFTRLLNIMGVVEEISLSDDEVIAHKNKASLNRYISTVSEKNLREWYNNEYEFIKLCKGLNN